MTSHRKRPGKFVPPARPAAGRMAELEDQLETAHRSRFIVSVLLLGSMVLNLVVVLVLGAKL